ncbi:MAG TPA: hypothetical protein VGZ23_01255 [bacterium]|nr:hypothetical protein [bacterium]
MRRIVCDFIAAAIDRTRPELEQFIAGHLECPEAVPLIFTDPKASIREIREVKVEPRFPADYPSVDVVAAMSVSLTARTRQRGLNLGIRTFLIDVQVDAIGTVRGDGYDVVRRRARLVAWWSR